MPTSPPKLWSPSKGPQRHFANVPDAFQRYSAELEAKLSEGKSIATAYEAILREVAEELRREHATLKESKLALYKLDEQIQQNLLRTQQLPAGGRPLASDALRPGYFMHPGAPSSSSSADAEIYDLARVMEDRGDLGTAAFLCRQVVNHRARELGELAPATLGATRKLASLLMDLGQIDEAAPLYFDVWRGHRTSFGPKHPAVLSAAADCAMALREKGKIGAAEALLRQVVTSQGKILGPNHRDSLTSVGNLADLLREQGQLEEADEVLGDSIATATQALGSHHQTTLILQAKAARLHHAFGGADAALAEAALEDVVQRMATCMGSRHPQFIKYHHVLQNWRVPPC